MRKETQEIVDAWLDGKSKQMARTATDGNSIYLHGHLIACYVKTASGQIKGYKLTMAGWPTMTTRDRLNGVLEGLGLNARFFQKKGLQYFSDETGERVVDENETIFIPA